MVSSDVFTRLMEQTLAIGQQDFNIPPPLPPEGGRGNGDGMESRIAKLEASMDHVKSELSKLSTLPVDVATIKERLNHVPTSSEMSAAIEAAVERIGSRTQRVVGIAAASLGALVGIITLAAKLISG